MTTRSWIRQLFARPPRTPRKAPARCRPTVEALEGRLVPATYVVTNTLDGGAGSLRAAIDAANASAGVADTIVFDLPAGQETITAVPDETTNPNAFADSAGDSLGNCLTPLYLWHNWKGKEKQRGSDANFGCH
jgi:hypothetical protein